MRNKRRKSWYLSAFYGFFSYVDHEAHINNNYYHQCHENQFSFIPPQSHCLVFRYKYSVNHQIKQVLICSSISWALQLCCAIQRMNPNKKNYLGKTKDNSVTKFNFLLRSSLHCPRQMLSAWLRLQCEEGLWKVSFRFSINKSAVSLTTAVASRCMGIYIVPTCINDVVASQQGGCVLNAQSYIPYSGIEMTRMIELGQKSKPRKNSRIFNITPQKSLDQKFNPQKVPCRISEP